MTEQEYDVKRLILLVEQLSDQLARQQEEHQNQIAALQKEIESLRYDFLRNLTGTAAPAQPSYPRYPWDNSGIWYGSSTSTASSMLDPTEARSRLGLNED